MRTSRATLAFVVLASLFLTACTLDQLNAITAASVVMVRPDSSDLEIGSRDTLVAEAYLASGAPLYGYLVVWSSADSSIVKVSQSGEVVGVAEGTADVIASVGATTGQARVRVRKKPAIPVATVAVAPTSATLDIGATVQLAATLRDASGNTLSGRTVTWTTSSAVTATVTNSGLVSAVAAGTATITAASEGKSGTSAITVNAAAPPPPPPPPPPTGTVADPTLLPVASRQLPLFERYTGRSLAAGGSYLDPVTGVRIWKATGPSTPVGNSAAAHDYGSGAVQASRDWGTNQHTILVNVAGHYLVDFTRGAGFSNWRPTPGVNADLCFTFSQKASTPRIAYYVSGTTLYRYDTQTNAQAPNGFFPKSFASVTSASLLWLQQDKNDEWFVMMPNDQSMVIAWNSVTNVTQVIRPGALDEPHLDKDGRFVALLIGATAPDWRLYDLQTQTLGAPISKQTHLEGIRSLFVSSDPDIATGPQYYYDPYTSRQVSTLTASQVSPDGQHRSGQWVQPDAQLSGGSLLKQWYLWSGFEDGIVTPGSWTLQGGQVYWTTPGYAPVYQKLSIGVQSVRQLVTGDPNRVARQLAKATSLAAMVEGSFYFDAATNRVYVWMAGGGSPAGAVELRAPGGVHDGIAFIRADGSDVRLLAHHYSHRPSNYWDIPRATVSADGKLVVFSSNQNATGGRSDVFVAEVPLR